MVCISIERMSNFEELLEQDGRLVYRTRGYSMLPMLHQNQDLVMVEIPKGRLKKYDVALYRRGLDYVLHRVIGLRDGEYLIRGDNTYKIEHVPDEAVIGVLTRFVRNGKEHSAEEFGYKIYSRFWNEIYPARVCYLRLRRAAGKAARKVGLKK